MEAYRERPAGAEAPVEARVVGREEAGVEAREKARVEARAEGGA